MSAPLRFASINIEGDTHLDRVLSFLKDFKPDVVCFQELFEHRVPFFEEKLGMKGHFAPMTRGKSIPKDDTSPIATFGLGLYSKLLVTSFSIDYYFGGSGDIPNLIYENEETLWRAILKAQVSKGNDVYTIATTHFTRTPDGSPSEKQRRDLKEMNKVIGKNQDLVLAGDFNAPRGLEIFEILSKKYKDNIPAKYDSSLDPNLHKAGHLKLMVDCLFTTPEYEATEVKLSEGVSDHLAITALISRKG